MTARFEDRVVDGDMLRFALLDPMSALTLLNRIARAVGPGLLRAAGSALDSRAASIADIKAQDLSDAVTALLDRLNDAEVRAIVHGLLGCVQLIDEDDRGARARDLLSAARPAESLYAVHYTGRLLAFVQVVRVSFEVNYGDFLEFLRGLMPKVVQKGSGSAG